MDRRARKSRAAVKDAYLQLIREQDPADVSISDLCQKADINRTTFYHHYEYLENLEKHVIYDILEDMVTQLTGSDHSLIPYSKLYIPEMTRTFVNLFKDDPYIRIFLNSRRREYYRQLFVDTLVHIMLEADPSYRNGTPSDKFELVFQNSGSCSLLITWIDEHRYVSSDEISAIIARHYAAGGKR